MIKLRLQEIEELTQGHTIKFTVKLELEHQENRGPFYPALRLSPAFVYSFLCSEHLLLLTTRTRRRKWDLAVGHRQ